MSDESQEVRDLMATADLGLAVDSWLRGPIGAMVANRAEIERTRLLEMFTQVDPFDSKAVLAIQTRINVVDAVMQYLADAVKAAEVAMSRLDQLEQDD